MKNLENLGDRISREDLNCLLGSEVIKENDKRKQKIASLVNDKKILPVIGCGVSVPYGLPTWKSLTTRLFPQCFEHRRADHGYVMKHYINVWKNLCKDFYEKKKSTGCDPLTEIRNGIIKGDITPPGCNDTLEYAEYIKLDFNGISDQFDESFRDKICHTLEFEGKDPLPDKKHEFTEVELKNKMPSALSVCADIMRKHHIDAVTYNFDNLLEAILELKNSLDPDNMVYINSITDAKTMRDRWDYDAINIYHVHGYVGLKGLDELVTKGGGSVKDLMSRRLIFAESDYYDAEHYLYDWMHAIQAEQMSKKHMIFLGFSGQDYNFKRILKNVRPNHELLTNHGQFEHYIFLCIEDIIKEIKLPYSILEDDGMYQDAMKLMMNSIMYYKELYLRSHGILPIWTGRELLPYDLIDIRDYGKSL